jgi:hypothetical protein
MSKIKLVTKNLRPSDSESYNIRQGQLGLQYHDL